MPTDLSYFKESELNKFWIWNFSESLPSDKVKQIFVNSMGPRLRAFSSESSEWRPGIVLQGYRGPHTNGSSGDSEKLDPCYGLQEVKYWYASSKKLNLIPGIGTIIFLVESVAVDTSWRSIYFDSQTGECLSHDKNEAASELNKKGIELCSSGKFTEAKEYFNNAYRSCSSGYLHEKTFQNNRDATALAVEGQTLLNSGKFAEAKEKFQAAYDKSNVSEIYSKFSNCRDATALAVEGQTLLNSGKFADAKEKFNEACSLSSCSEVSTKFSSWKAEADKAIAEKAIADKAAEDEKAEELKKAAADKAAADKAAEELVAIAKKIHQEGLDMFINANELKDLNQALKEYENVADKYGEAAAKKKLDIIADSLILLATKCIEIGGLDQADKAIKVGEEYFHSENANKAFSYLTEKVDNPEEVHEDYYKTARALLTKDEVQICGEGTS